MTSGEKPAMSDEQWFDVTGGQSADPEGEKHVNPVPPTAEQVKAALEQAELTDWLGGEPMF